MDKKIIVFDIDGTLANIQHRRQYVASRPKNWAAFNAGMKFDTVYEDIKWMNVNFAAQGHTIILTTHYLEEAEMLCHRTAMLKGGRIVALDTTKALLARAGGNLEQAFIQIMNAEPSTLSEVSA